MMFIIRSWFCYDRKQNRDAFQESIFASSGYRMQSDLPQGTAGINGRCSPFVIFYTVLILKIRLLEFEIRYVVTKSKVKMV
jgi:hypothetical protein